MIGLRDYQEDLYLKARQALSTNKSICIQSPTGSGKTPLFSAMCNSVVTKKKRAWIIVPRTELLKQASTHLLKWNVNHGVIAPGLNESNAYKIHVVSKDTLIRRYNKIKNWPDLMIFDESHLYIDRQHEIISHLPEYSKVIGFTATPERMDGRGLSEVYNQLIEGPSIPWLTERGFLTELRYFSPPIEGLQNLHVRGTDYDQEELEELLKRKKIYGELIGHYSKHGRGKAALIFCRSVKSAYQTAERFREKGFNFHCIEGKLTPKKRKDLIDALTNGIIDGLTNCDICTYGLDVPRVEYGASIRPTLSRALYMQIIGRILRPFENKETGYKKEEALFFDHVNLVLEHQDESYPGVPLHYVPDITWNFHGNEKRKRKKDDKNIKLCPLMDFLYCDKPSCRGCPHNPDNQIPDQRKPMIVVPTELEEIKKPIPLNERPIEERRELQDRINAAAMDYKNNMNPGAIGELIKIQEELGYSPLWIYWKLTPDDQYTINYPVLHEIARQKGYKPGWVHFIKKKIDFQKKTKKEYERAMEV
jgi:superfamily II DNA or RNA helicase